MILSYYKLIYFLPIALITGPFLPDLIIVLCSLLFVFDTFRLKLFKYFNKIFFKFFFVFFITLNLSSFFSENLMSLKYSLGYLRYGIFSILLFYILKNIKNSKLIISYSIIFTYIILLIDGYLQFIFGKNIFLFEIQKYNENASYVTSFFNDEKKLGSYLAKMFPLFLFSISIIRNKLITIKLEKFISLFFVLIFLMIILTTERVSIFVFLSLILIVFIKSEIFLKPKLIYFCITILSSIILFYYYPEFLYKIKSILYSTGLVHPGYSNDGKVLGEYDVGKFVFSKFHHEQIKSSIYLFLENPLLGIGAKNYKYMFVGGWHPHNYTFQILAEIGIFGFLIFFSSIIFLLFKFIKKFFKPIDKHLNSEINIYLLAGILLNLIPIPSGDFFNNWVNILIYFPVGYYLYLNEK